MILFLKEFWLKTFKNELKLTTECGNVAIHDLNDIYVLCCREISKKHNTNIQYYHLKLLFW